MKKKISQEIRNKTNPVQSVREQTRSCSHYKITARQRNMYGLLYSPSLIEGSISSILNFLKQNPCMNKSNIAHIQRSLNANFETLNSFNLKDI